MTQLSFALPGSSAKIVAPSGIPEPLSREATAAGSAIFATSTNLLFGLASFLALAFIIFSGIQWITSGGDYQKIAAAKSRLMYAIIGLVVVILAFFIISVILAVFGKSSGIFLNPWDSLNN